MGYYQPIITLTDAEFQHQIPLLTHHQVLVGPYHHPTSSFDRSILLFDLPKELLIQIGSVYLSGSSFDYLNPLIWNSEIASQVKFSQEHFDCWCVYLKQPAILNRLIEDGVYYASGFFLNYQKMEVSRNGRGLTLAERFLLPHRTVVPMNDILVNLLSQFTSS